MRRKAFFELMLGHTQSLVHVTTEKHLNNINHAMYRFNISGRATDATGRGDPSTPTILLNFKRSTIQKEDRS